MSDSDPLFDDRQVVADLRNRVMRGGAVKLASRALLLGLRVAGVVVMARLISPSDYGLFLMATSFTVFLGMFEDVGLARATVQSAQIDRERVSTLFWVNAAAGVLLFLLVLAAAPVLAWFYGEARLAPVTAAMGVPFVLTGLSVQHGALLQRQMRFVTLESIAVVAQVSGAAAMFVSAWLGAGYWSLALNIIVIRTVTGALTWWHAGWRPGPPRSLSAVRGMLVFGGQLTGSNIVNYFHRNLDNILIGWYWGPQALGIYSKAYGLLKQPLSQIGTPTSSVIVPALSRLQGEPARYRNYFIKAMRAVCFAAMPMVVFTFVDARELILILLGARWLEVVPLFQALAPAALLGISQVFAGWLYQSLGRADRLLKSSVAVLGVVAVAFGAGLPWGALGVAAAYSAAFCLIVAPFLAYAARGTPVSLGDVGAAAWRPVLFSLACGAVASWFRGAVPVPGPVAARLAADGAVFGLAYAALWACFPGGREYVASIAGPFWRWSQDLLRRKAHA